MIKNVILSVIIPWELSNKNKEGLQKGPGIA